MHSFDLDIELKKHPEALAKVLTKPETLKITTFSSRTWQRLEERGQTPPKTQLSDNRIGYRLIDVIRWLDQRRKNNEEAA